MMNEDIAQTEIEAGIQDEKRNSAATIEHTEVHVDLSKTNNNDPVITTGTTDTPGVKVLLLFLHAACIPPYYKTDITGFI